MLREGSGEHSRCASFPGRGGSILAGSDGSRATAGPAGRAEGDNRDPPAPRPPPDAPRLLASRRREWTLNDVAFELILNTSIITRPDLI